MNAKLIFILLLAAIVESTIVAFPVTLIVISIYALCLGSRAAKWAFVGGLILDILSLRNLGLTSLFFLILCWMVDRYQKKIQIGSIAYFIIFLGLASALYGFLFYKYVTGLILLQSLILGSILFGAVSSLTNFSGEKAKKIRV